MALVDLRKVNDDYTPTYNTLWGYFAFAQTIQFEYSQVGLYKTVGEFKINGVIVPQSGTTDEDKFNSVKTQYNALADAFRACIGYTAPSDLTLYGTSSDSRCIALPSPLVTAASGTVYAQPMSLSIEETQWPSMLKYTAVLKEATAIEVAIVVDTIPIQNAVVTIELETPRLSTQKYAFANSEELFFNGWNPRSFSINGMITMPSGFAAGSTLAVTEVKSMINNLMDGKVTVSKKVGNTVTALFSDLFIEQSSVNIEKTNNAEGFPINISARY